MTAKARRKRPSKGRSLARICAAVFLFAFAAWLVAGVWFVHHPRKWLEERRAAWPAFATDALLWIGNPAGDVTDGIGLTGEDAVVTLPRKAPSGEVLFAGAPVRVREPAPDDIKVLDRGEFLVGWSPRLRHPVWCAYHVPPEVRFESAPRPAFRKDGAYGGLEDIVVGLLDRLVCHCVRSAQYGCANQTYQREAQKHILECRLCCHN